MGRQTLLLAVCWLTLSQSFGDPGHGVKHISGIEDNVSAASARLYRNVPVGVYASAAPHGAYSFHLPAYIDSSRAASQSVPVKQTANSNSYLKDSYGNSFLASPQMQMLAYKTAFPQQYPTIQSKLPEHLEQPLVATSPNFHFQTTSPQVYFGAPYRVPAIQAASPAIQGPSTTPLHHFPTFGQLYGENVKSVAPSAVQHQVFGIQVQQSSNSRPASTTNYEQYGSLKKEPTYQHVQQKPQTSQSGSTYQQIQGISHAPVSEMKFQRFEETPQVVYGNNKIQRLPQTPSTAQMHHTYERLQETPKRHQEANSQATHNHKTQIQAAPAKQTSVTYIDSNGQKSVVKLDTKPNVPLLDITLLEPLTFKNPLVPQVQHFLPRIHQATYQKLPLANVKNYQKEFVVSQTMSYTNDEVNGKPKDASKKKQKKPTQTHKYSKKNEAPKKNTVTYDHLDDVPEITYEINAPNYKETIKEKSVSYSKNTESDPVHYTYGSKAQKNPVTYSYSRTSKEPIHIQEVHYQGNGPSHLVHNFKPDEQSKDENTHKSTPQNDNHNQRESSQEAEEDGQNYHNSGEQYSDQPTSSEVHDKPTQHYHHQINGEQHNDVRHGQPHHYSAPQQHKGHVELQPITKEYEEDIRLYLPSSAPIKVNPNQHVQTSTHPKPHSSHHDEKNSYESKHSNSEDDDTSHTLPRHSHSSHSSHEHPHTSPAPKPHNYYSNPHSHSESYEGPSPHIHEKSKRIIIQEESPDERHVLTEQMKAEMIKQEENSEDDFEKAYQASAFGFPAYNSKSDDDAEKDIFDPESYGVPPENVKFDIENTPFQQYQEEGDEYPKATRSSYKDARDKMKQDYYSDYAISKPESLLDRYQNKLGYYKMYKQQKPDYASEDEDDGDRKPSNHLAKFTVTPSFHYGPSKEKSSKKLAKFTVAPSYNFGPSDESQSYYGHHKPKEQLHEYDYSKGNLRDSSAFATRPYQSYKTKTSFVEPQFQYGFEPIPLTKLDSELAAMASNHSPESEKQGTRKKMYKENWYIKKTTSTAGAPTS